jgi:hypothetical protein
LLALDGLECREHAIVQNFPGAHLLVDHLATRCFNIHPHNGGNLFGEL